MRPSLSYVPNRGVWHAHWSERTLSLCVAGTEVAPHPALEATLGWIVDHIDAVERAVEDFVIALPCDAHVPFWNDEGSFASADCGFERGALQFFGISVEDADAETRAELTFATGYPDGYVTFTVVLEAGAAISLTAGWS